MKPKLLDLFCGAGGVHRAHREVLDGGCQIGLLACAAEWMYTPGLSFQVVHVLAQRRGEPLLGFGFQHSRVA